MKKIIAAIFATILLATTFTGCFSVGNIPEPTQSISTTPSYDDNEDIEDETEEETTVDEFPTYADDEDEEEDEDTDVSSDTFTYTEPQGRWSVEVPNVWNELGKIVERSDNYIRFVYKKAYDDYGAGHVFTIGTASALDPYDVSQLPHGEEIYLDGVIQVYIEYPTDVQYGGLDGSDMATQSVEYGKLKDTINKIKDSLKIL